MLHLKLDELIRVNESARNRLLDLEGLSEEELGRLKGAFTKLAGAPDPALLQEAIGDLDAAGDEIRGAKEWRPLSNEGRDSLGSHPPP